MVEIRVETRVENRLEIRVENRLEIRLRAGRDADSDTARVIS